MAGDLLEPARALRSSARLAIRRFGMVSSAGPGDVWEIEVPLLEGVERVCGLALFFLQTDAVVADPETALRRAAQRSFKRITVEGR